MREYNSQLHGVYDATGPQTYSASTLLNHWRALFPVGACVKIQFVFSISTRKSRGMLKPMLPWNVFRERRSGFEPVVLRS